MVLGEARVDNAVAGEELRWVEVLFSAAVLVVVGQGGATLSEAEGPPPPPTCPVGEGHTPQTPS